MYRIAVLTIGDELCIGQVINSNAAWIATKCTELGAKVILQSVVPDDKQIMLNELDRLFGFADMVITSGGLGPTHDDITKSTVAEYFGKKLVRDEATYEYLKYFFELRGRKFLERHEKQAEIPEGTVALPNTVGTAPGIYIEGVSKTLISLPGVPNEMISIFGESVRQIIISKLEKADTVVAYKTLITAGIPESELAELIRNPEDFLYGSSLAFLPSYRGVRLRIGVEKESFIKAKEEINRIEEIIIERAGDRIVGTSETTPEERLARKLVLTGKTVALAESCTGGMLGTALTSVPGSSEFFLGGVLSYSNDVKIKILKVNKKDLEDFGAVSKQVAVQMAKNVRELIKSDYGISITGIAGPGGGTVEKPVGTVWIGISSKEYIFAEKHIFGNERRLNRELSVTYAINMLINELNKHN